LGIPKLANNDGKAVAREKKEENEEEWGLQSSRLNSDILKKLEQLEQMGDIYACRPFNTMLLEMYHGDMNKVLAALRQYSGQPAQTIDNPH